MKRLHKFFCLLLIGAALLGTAFTGSLAADAATPTYTVSSAYKNSVYYANLGKVQLTGNARDDIVRVALSQVGYHEGNSSSDFAGGNTSGKKNFVEYNRLHGTVYDSTLGKETYGYYWCASFATWCANQAGIDKSVVPIGGTAVSTERLRTWFMNNATYKARGSYTPITGDFVFFCDDPGRNTTHVGIVLYVKGSTVYVVEGNAGSYEAVAIKNYTLTNTYIVGYGIPKYKTGNTVTFDPSDKSAPGTYIITASSLAIRSGPGVSNSQLGNLPLSATVSVSEVSSGWGKISYGGISGWCSLSYAMPLSCSDLTVSYDANGGVGAPASQQKISGVDMVLSNTVPVREGYNFLGWSTSSSATSAMYAAGGLYTADKSITLYAVWQKKTVTVRFRNADGTMLSEKTYYWGDTIKAPANPERVADKVFRYTFSGWSPELDTFATTDVTYTAQYNTEYILYTVKFCDEDGTLLSSGTYHYGDTITATPTPTKPADKVYSYTFIGWGESVRRVDGNKTYTAVYDKNYLNYSITFADSDGRVLSQKVYHYGEAVVPPKAPDKPSDERYDYVFLGWDKGVSEVTGHTVYTAVYARNDRIYTIRFRVGDKLIDEQLLRYGEMPTIPADPAQEADEENLYLFAGWSPAIGAVTGDVTYEAVFQSARVEYAVTFVDEAGHIYRSELYHYGDTVIPPENPTMESTESFRFIFDGWSPALEETVTKDAVYTAKFRAEPIDGGIASDGMNTGLTFFIAFVSILLIGGAAGGTYWVLRARKQ